MATKKKSNMNSVVRKSKNFTSPWLKNALKSIGVSAASVFEDIAPNIYDISTSSAKTARDLSTAIKNGSHKTFLDSMKNNRYVKAGSDAIKYTIEDLKSGKLNNQDRADEMLMKDLMGDDFANMEEDFSFDDWGDEEGSANIQINNISDSNASAQMAVAVSGNITRAAVSQLKGQKAQIDTIVAISSASMMQQQENTEKVLSHLGNISNQLNSIVEFNTSVMGEYIKSSTAYMEKMGATIEASYDKDTDKTTSIYRNLDGGINASEYINHVKKNLKKTLKDSDLGMVAGLMSDDMMLNMLISNPVGGLLNLMVAGITPKVLKTSLSSLDNAIAGFLPTLFTKIADWSDNPGSGKGRTIRQYLGKTFGLRNKRVKSFDLSEGIKAEPTPFDKVTRHNIIETIPKELSEQTALLKEIVRLMGGRNIKDVLADAERFNYREGRYDKRKDIQKELLMQIDDAAVSRMSSSKFADALRTKNPYLMGIGNSKDSDLYEKMMTDLFRSLERHGKFVDVGDMSKTGTLEKLLSGLKYDEKNINYLRAALKSVLSDKDAVLSLNPAIQSSVASRNDIIRSMTADPAYYNLYESNLLGANLDAKFDKVFKETIGDPEKTKGTTVNSILTDIRFLLDRGINVRIVPGVGGFKSALDSNGVTISKNSSDVVLPSPDKLNEAEKSIFDSGTLSESDFYNKILEAEKEQAMFNHEKKSKVASHVTDAFHALAFGSSDQAFSEFGKAFGEGVSGLFTNFNKHFLTPMKESVFGSKDERGYSRDGLFSGLQNKMLDTVKSFKREFTGSGYIDSHGNLVKEKGKDEETVVGNIKSFTRNIKDDFMDYVFGPKNSETGERDGEKAGSFIGKFKGMLDQGIHGWSEVIFGDEVRTKEDRKKKLAEVKEKVSDALPSAITGGIAGSVVGTIAGKSLLGAVLGPIGGAIVGSGIGFLSRSDRFKDWLFGKEEDGERVGGLISKNVQDYIKKNKTLLVGSGTLGAITGTFTGGGLIGSILGPIVGGPIAGSLMGMATGIVMKSNTMQNLLFGSEGEKGKPGVFQKGILGQFKSIFKRKNKDDEDPSGGKLLGMAGLGMGAGALSASLLGQIGIIGGALTPFGPVGGALAGLALSISASKKGFHDYLFGKTDKDGNKRFGVLEKFGNMLDVELFQPMKDGLANFKDEAELFILEKIAAPFNFAIAPLTKALSNTADAISNRVHKFMKTTGDYIKDKLIDPFVDNARKFLITPLRKISSFMFKGITGMIKTFVSMPFTALGLIGNVADTRNRRTSRKKVMRENRKKGFMGRVENMMIRMHYGDMYNEASERYNDYMGTERDEERQRVNEEIQNRKNTLKENREMRRNRARNRRMIAMMTGDRYTRDTEENRIRAQEMYDQRRAGNKIFKYRKDIKWAGDRFYDEDETKKDSSTSKSGNTPSNSDILKNTDKADTPVEQRQLGVLMRIYNLLRGVKPNESNFGDSSPNKESSKTESPTSKFDNDVSDYFNDILDSDVDDKSRKKKSLYIDPVSGKSFDSLEEMNKFINGDLTSNGAEKKKNRFSKIKNLASRFHLPKFAAGGTSNGGYSLVGEEGAEIVELPDGTRVHSNRNPLPVIIKDISDRSVDKLDKKLDGNGEKAEVKSIHDINAEKSKSAYEKARNENSYETLMKEKKERENEEFKDRLLGTLNETKEGEKKHHSLWASIFSKKGLITGALLALSPLIFNFLKNLIPSLGNLLENFFKDWKFGRDNLENEGTPAERLGDNIEDAKELLQTGNLYEYLFPGGERDHLTNSKINFFAHVPNLFKMGANKFKNSKFVKATNSFIGKAVGKGKGLITGAKSLLNHGSNFKNIVKGYGGGLKGTKEALSTYKSFKASKTGNALAQTAGNVGVTLKATGDDLVKKTVSKENKSMINMVKEAFMKLWDEGVKYAAKIGKKVSSKLPKVMDDAIKFCAKHAATLAKKIAPILAGAVNVAGTVLKDSVMVTLGAINGVSGARRLFHIDGDVNARMIGISTAYGALAGSTVGSVIDIVNEFIFDIEGIDLIHELACTIYDFMADDKEYDELIEKKDAFKERYLGNKNTELRSQYETYLKLHGYTEETYPFDLYVANVESGEIDVRTTSFSNFNDKEHATFGSKISDAANKWIFKPIGKAGTGIKNWFVGSKEESYVDESGNTWKYDKSKDVYNITDKSGKSLGYQATEELSKTNAKQVVTEHKGIVDKGVDAIKSFGKAASDGFKFIKDSTVSAFKGYTKGKKQIESNLKSTSSNRTAFKNSAIKSGLPTSNPFAGAIDTLLNLDNLVSNMNNLFFSMTNSGSNLMLSTSSVINRSNSLLSSSGFKMARNTGGRGGLDIPYFSQNDPSMSNYQYGDETMSEAGCGPTSMAMVATGLNGARGTSPIDMAEYSRKHGFRDETGTNWNFIDKASNDFGFNSNKQYAPTSDFISNQLDNGNPVILSGQGGMGTPYTSGGHYVVATGKDNNGNIMINDPRGKQYSGAYPESVVANNANVAWGISKKNRGGRGSSKRRFFGIRKGGGRGADSELQAKARAAVCATMTALKGKLRYTMGGDRSKVIQALTTGSGAGDCSSTCYYVYKECTGIDIGSSTSTQINNANGVDVDTNTGGIPDEANLLPGDLLYYAKPNSSSVGHVEMYMGNGTVMGHGGKADGPTVKNLREYTMARNAANKKYLKARRFIHPNSNINLKVPAGVEQSLDDFMKNGGLSAYDGTTNVMGTGEITSSGPMDILSTIGSFFTQFATKAFHGLLTGNWDTNYTFNDDGVYPTSYDNSGTGGVDMNSVMDVPAGQTELGAYTFFTKSGLTPAATAGIMGNIHAESNFKPDAIQGNGKGPAAGLFQWENYNTKSKRWKAMSDYAASLGRDWTDPGAQLAYALEEMKNESWMWKNPSNSSLAHVSSFDEFTKLTDPATAAIAFSNHFERPGKPRNEVRVSAANRYYQKYYKDIPNQFFSTVGNVVTGVRDGISTGISNAKSFVGDKFNSIKNKLFGGGRGGNSGNNVIALSGRHLMNQPEMNQSPSVVYGHKLMPNNYNSDTSSRRALRRTIVRGGSGNDVLTNELLGRVITLLESIAGSTSSADTKLNYLQEIKPSSSVLINNNGGGKGGNQNPQIIMVPQKNEQIITNPNRTRSEEIAKKIASGF